MEPTIRLGDAVRIDGDRSAPRAGEVVAFRGSRGLIVHRVWLAVPGVPWFVHAGDGVCAEPGIARADRVVGRVAGAPARPVTWAQRAAAVRRVARGLLRQL